MTVPLDGLLMIHDKVIVSPGSASVAPDVKLTLPVLSSLIIIIWSAAMGLAALVHPIATVPVARFDVAPLASSAKYVNNQVPHAPVVGINSTQVPLMLAMPPDILVTQVTDNTPPSAVPKSASVSLNKTATTTVTFLFVEAVSSTATGASLTQTTVMVAVTILDPDGQSVSVS